MRTRLRVNPLRCDGHGLCAELFWERVRLDDFGYPIIDPTPFGESLLVDARRAVAACPRSALLLENLDDS
ncbi:MAG: ferredoxin [Candidatus Dormibacteria bacterium]